MDYATRAARDMLAERWRQIEEFGLTFELDDRYCAEGQLARAAVHYAADADLQSRFRGCDLDLWPYPDHPPAAGSRREELIKAGALILAEVERLDRLAAPKGAA